MEDSYGWRSPCSIDVELIAFITGLPTMGESPTQYLDDKTKEKSLAEEMKKTYGTERGSRRIIIKRINDTTRDGHQTHGLQDALKMSQGGSPCGVIAAAAQCANGTLLSWAPYLLNLFLDDCKDAQDLGT
jgi:hypothetical protein